MDELYLEFGNKVRNLRLGLATDGMNPFGQMSTAHSSWPMLMCIYNLSPLLCMQRKYMMLTMLIFGPRQARNDIDTYISPLIEELRTLWLEGVVVEDGYKNNK